MKIAITGGAGFIGSHLVDTLIGNELLVIDNLSSSTVKYIQNHIDSGDVKFVNADIASLDSSLLDGVDIIYHYAACPDVRLSSEATEKIYHDNVLGTFRILEAMRKNDVKKIVFASTSTVYGKAEKIPTPEEYPNHPISNYAASKIFGEAFIQSYAATYGFDYTIVRYANIFGPRSNHGVIWDFYHKLMKNPNELLILGNGLQNKSYLYIDDAVEATLLAAKANGIFNIGSEEQITVNEIARIVAAELGLNPKFKYTAPVTDKPVGGWKGDVPAFLLDVTKIKTELGWSPKTPIRDAIKKYIDWMRKV